MQVEYIDLRITFGGKVTDGYSYGTTDINA